jgi:hypothetical protein
MKAFAVIEHLGRGRVHTVAFAASRDEADGLIYAILKDLPGAVLSVIRMTGSTVR